MLEGIQKIWNDDNLYGHCLTTLPSTLWHFATSDKLITYTQPDLGTAERVLLIFEKYTRTEKHPNGNPENITFGTNCLIFTYAEIGFRRIAGTLLTVGATVTAAPLGFAIKAIQNTFA